LVIVPVPVFAAETVAPISDSPFDWSLTNPLRVWCWDKAIRETNNKFTEKIILTIEDALRMNNQIPGFIISEDRHLRLNLKLN